MDILGTAARLLGIGLAIFFGTRGLRGAHPQDQAMSLLRWSVVLISASIYTLSFFGWPIPDKLLWISIFAFTIFFFLPDSAYYLVLGLRKSIATLRRQRV